MYMWSANVKRPMREEYSSLVAQLLINFLSIDGCSIYYLDMVHFVRDTYKIMYTCIMVEVVLLAVKKARYLGILNFIARTALEMTLRHYVHVCYVPVQRWQYRK